PELEDLLLHTNVRGHALRTLSLASREQLASLLTYLLDEQEFLAPHGIRSLSAAHRDGVQVQLGQTELGLRYEPAESRSGMFGGNSNWRGPIWFPVNSLLTDALRIYGRGAGAGMEVEFPTGSGQAMPLVQI